MLSNLYLKKANGHQPWVPEWAMAKCCYDAKPGIIANKHTKNCLSQKLLSPLIENDCKKGPITVWTNKIQVMKIQTCTMPKFSITLNLVHKHLICHISTKRNTEKLFNFPCSKEPNMPWYSFSKQAKYHY